MILGGGSPAEASVRSTPLEVVVTELGGPVAVRDALPTLFGFAPTEVEPLGWLLFALSPEVEVLLDGVDTTFRHLAQGLSVRLERCIHEVRGQVSWSETLQIWGNSYGATDVFVCRNQFRDHDVAENRVLAWALRSVIRATSALADPSAQRLHPAIRDDIAERGRRARRLSSHQALEGVAVRRPSPGELHKTRISKHRRSYSSALDTVARARDPFTPAALSVLSDWRTAAQHEVLAAALERLRAVRGTSSLWVEDGVLTADGLEYRHWSNEGSGIVVGGIRLDVASGPTAENRGASLAQLEHRNATYGARSSFLVTTPDELAIALDMALEPVSGGVIA